MTKIGLIVFSVFILLSCKTTKQAIYESENTEAPDVQFEEGLVEEIEIGDTNTVSTNDTSQKREKKEPMPYRKEMKLGIDFIATGTEPFWSLEIELDSSITFTSLSEIDSLTLPFIEPIVQKDRDVFYGSTTKKRSTKILVKDTACVNQLSGDEFSYSVEVSIKEKGMKGFKNFTGCGQYLGDFHMTGEWDFITINGDSIPQTAEMPKTPFITFSLKEGSLAGYAGCNTIHGAFDFGYKTINFSPLVSTRMSCPNMELETTVIKALSDKSYNYTVTDNDLILQNEENKMVFKKH